MQALPHDVQMLHEALHGVEKDSKGLRWAKERPWRCASHIWEEHGLAVIDLHDLNAGLTKKIVRAVESIAEKLETGGVVFITGIGRHSAGVPVLRRVVLGTLTRFEQQKGWRHRDVGGGRLLLVVDESRIPKFWGQQTPAIAIWFFAFFCVALTWALQGSVLIAILIVAAVLVVRFVRRLRSG